MKKGLVFLVFGLLFGVSSAQTNVSGGIYANTTWTKINSPYIVTDTVAVFPGVTLTIESGVVVKFADNKRLEVRGASLIAIGTSSDSITFTSDTSQTPGAWSEIILDGGPGISKFNYCNFRYAKTGLYDNRGGLNDSLVIKNSNFNFNTIGLNGMGCTNGIFDTCDFSYNVTFGARYVEGAVISNCVFSHNQTGLQCDQFNKIKNSRIEFNVYGIQDMLLSSVDNCMINNNQYGIVGDVERVAIRNTNIDSNTVVGITITNTGGEDTIISCQIKYNTLGLDDYAGNPDPNIITKNIIESNSIGLRLEGTVDKIFCNKICNNTAYNLYYNVAFGDNLSLPNNDWCNIDSANIEATIYDGYDNINLGLFSFMPFDESQCYLTTSIPQSAIQNPQFEIFPNPATTQLNITINQNWLRAIDELPLLNIYNITGALVQATQLQTVNNKLETGNLPTGVYIAEVKTREGSFKKRWVKM